MSIDKDINCRLPSMFVNILNHRPPLLYHCPPLLYEIKWVYSIWNRCTDSKNTTNIDMWGHCVTILFWCIIDTYIVMCIRKYTNADFFRNPESYWIIYYCYNSNNITNLNFSWEAKISPYVLCTHLPMPMDIDW